jgi:hypothetical protein
MPAVKKVKRKQQHQRAIKEYEVWLRRHPKASHRQKFQMFDTYVDSSELAELLEMEHAAAS